MLYSFNLVTILIFNCLVETGNQVSGVPPQADQVSASELAEVHPET
jgi:hypothetical protein